MQNNINNYNNHHGDYFLTMSLRINTENTKYSGRLMHGSSFSQGQNMGMPSWARFLKRKQV
jgi:hypothetical protein